MILLVHQQMYLHFLYHEQPVLRIVEVHEPHYTVIHLRTSQFGQVIEYFSKYPLLVHIYLKVTLHLQNLDQHLILSLAVSHRSFYIANLVLVYPISIIEVSISIQHYQNEFIYPFLML